MKDWIVKPLLVDFDGVLHGYPKHRKYGFELSDPIVPGAAKFINEVSKEFEVSIYSARSVTSFGQSMMKEYLLRKNVDISKLHWPTFKPAAWMTIDDRCICFNGKFPSVEELINFKAWYEK